MQAQNADAKRQGLAAQPAGGPAQSEPPGVGPPTPPAGKATRTRAAGPLLVLGPHPEPWTLPGADQLECPSPPVTPSTPETAAPLAEAEMTPARAPLASEQALTTTTAKPPAAATVPGRQTATAVAKAQADATVPNATAARTAAKAQAGATVPKAQAATTAAKPQAGGTMAKPATAATAAKPPAATTVSRPPDTSTAATPPVFRESLTASTPMGVGGSEPRAGGLGGRLRGWVRRRRVKHGSRLPLG